MMLTMLNYDLGVFYPLICSTSTLMALWSFPMLFSETVHHTYFPTWGSSTMPRVKADYRLVDGLAITFMCIVDEEPPTWRQDDDGMGLEIPPRTAKSAELVNGDLRGQMG